MDDTVVFDKDTKFPSDFKEKFLKNSENKNRLNFCLAAEFLLQYSEGKTVILTKDEAVLFNVKSLVTDLTPP